MASIHTSPVNQSAGPLAVGFLGWTSMMSPSSFPAGSGPEQRLDGAALVHGAVPLGDLLERQGQVEDLAGVDLAVPDEVDQLGQEAAHRCGTAVQVDVGEEHLLAGELDVMSDADVADVPAWPGGANGLHHRLLGADCLDHRVCAEPARELLDPRYALVPSLLDDVGGAELEGELLSWRVAAHGDDPFRAEVPCGQDSEQADCTITDHDNGLAGGGLGGD